jgi:hypothetical protein
VDGYGNDATEAFAELMNSMRGGSEGDVEEAGGALEYWLFAAARRTAPDLSDPRVQAAAGVPRWARHGPGDRPAPGLYLQRTVRGGFDWVGALFCCAGDFPPDARLGWGWLLGPLPQPPGWSDAPVPGRTGP